MWRAGQYPELVCPNRVNPRYNREMPQTQSIESPRPRRWRRRALVAVLVLLALFVAAELVARFALGLGDPPLLVSDPQIEYLFRPSQEVRRFGNRIHYNQWSMRSEDFDAKKTDPRELRVIVIGDSVINGGAPTDQGELATQILRERLEKELNRPVVVGNVSAATWGPQNMLAYVKRFGLFDADVVVIVLSSHDWSDVPNFQPVVGVHPSFPEHKPLLAVQELVSRYLLPRIVGPAGADAGTPSAEPPEPKDIDRSLNDLRELFEIAKSGGASVIVAQYLESKEVMGELREGHDAILKLATDSGAEVVQLGPAFRAAVQSGRNPFRDMIHPNAVGQKLIADGLYEKIVIGHQRGG